MSSASFPAPLSDRLLTGVGFLGLGATTLVYPASSQIYAEPLSFGFNLLLAVPVIAVLVRSATPSTWLLPSRCWLALTLGLGAIILASAWMSPFQSTILRWSALPLAGIALFFWVYDWLHHSPVDRTESLLRGLAWSTVAVTLVSFAQWTHQLLNHGFDDGVMQWLGAVRNPFPLGHSNYTAGAAVLGLPFVVHAAYRAQGAARSLWIMAAFLTVFILITSGSRGGLLGLVLLAGLGVVHLKLPPARLVAVLLTGLVIAAILAWAHPRIGQLLRPADPSAPPNLSSVQRRAMIQGGFLMGADRPVLGWGLHSTPLVYPRFRAQLDGGAENVLQLHNTPLEIWAGLGALGLAAGTALLALSLAPWRRHPSAAIALLGYAGFSLTDYQLDLPLIVAGLSVIAALLATATPVPFTPRRLSRSLLAAGTIGATGLVILFGREDPTPRLNAAALTLAQDPQLADRAMGLLEDSLALNANQEIAHFNLGWLQVVAAPAQAEGHFLAALQLVPDKGGAYFGLGLARLNQDHPSAAARAFALECLNDPAFTRSPWWKVPAIAAHREDTRQHFDRLIDHLATTSFFPANSWRHRQLQRLHDHSDLVALPLPGPEKTYRRERTGYPVLMRNSNIPAPLDLFDVREYLVPPSDLPPKGWLPAPLLLSLLDPSPPVLQ